MEIRQLYAIEQVNIDIYLLEDRINLATALVNR